MLIQFALGMFGCLLFNLVWFIIQGFKGEYSFKIFRIFKKKKKIETPRDRYERLAMEQIRSNKERKFKKGLQRRIELICNSLSLERDIDLFTDINIKLSNTLPQNVYELSQTIKNLSPYLSSETLLNQLPFVDNAKEEVEKKKAEEESEVSEEYDFTGIGGIEDGEEEN